MRAAVEQLIGLEAQNPVSHTFPLPYGKAPAKEGDTLTLWFGVKIDPAKMIPYLCIWTTSTADNEDAWLELADDLWDEYAIALADWDVEDDKAAPGCHVFRVTKTSKPVILACVDAIERKFVTERGKE